MRNNSDNAKQLIELGALIDVNIFYEKWNLLFVFFSKLILSIDIRWKKCYSITFCMSI